MKRKIDQVEFLRMALRGLERQHEDVAAKIAFIQGQIAKMDGKPLPNPAGTLPRSRHHNISQEGRERIAAAQRKRWAVIKKTRKKSRAAK